MARKTRKQSPWIQFVMKVKQENPGMDFKDVLKLAAKLKKQGKSAEQVVKTKTSKALKKINASKKSRGKKIKGKKNRKSSKK